MRAQTRHIRIYRDRRAVGVPGEADERRVYCWMIAECDPAVRANCHAFIVSENCWDFWTIKGAKYRGCCQKRDDCRDCEIVQRKFAGEELPVFVRPTMPAFAPPGLPGLIICDHLHFIGGSIPQGRALRQFLREQVQDDHDAFRCRRRGVHLDASYVAEICATRACRECVFL